MESEKGRGSGSGRKTLEGVDMMGMECVVLGLWETREEKLEAVDWMKVVMKLWWLCFWDSVGVVGAMEER